MKRRNQRSKWANPGQAVATPAKCDVRSRERAKLRRARQPRFDGTGLACRASRWFLKTESARGKVRCHGLGRLSPWVLTLMSTQPLQDGSMPPTRPWCSRWFLARRRAPDLGSQPQVRAAHAWTCLRFHVCGHQVSPTCPQGQPDGAVVQMAVLLAVDLMSLMVTLTAAARPALPIFQLATSKNGNPQAIGMNAGTMAARRSPREISSRCTIVCGIMRGQP